MVRYEAVYRFETPFEVTVEQGGVVLRSAVYGWRASPKTWAFGGDRMGCGAGEVGECVWPYGATEGMVWEGLAKGPLHLQAGTATVSVTSVGGPAGCGPGCHFANRNLDLIMLAPNASDLGLRQREETAILPFDGLASQHGEVFLRVTNHNATHNLTLTVPGMYIHSPYYSMHMVLNRSDDPAAPSANYMTSNKVIYVGPGATTA